ncbi:CHAT domain-containing protein [Phaeosphaeriaceae sp. PMI808]|nr:CHAT domain-containing protein [Phaeosphaeriaceae sp. PMI808]
MIIGLADTTGVEIQSKDDGSIFSSKIQVVFSKLIQDRKLSDAYRIACTYQSLSNVSEPDSLLKIVVNDSRTPLLLRAKSQLNLANALEHSKAYAEADKLMDAALENFERVGYQGAALEISTRRNLRSIDNLKSIVDSIGAYSELGPPNRLRSTLEGFLRLAFSSHIFNLQAQIVLHLEDLNKTTGAKLLSFLTRFQAFRVWDILMSHNGKVASGATELYAELQKSECQFLIGEAAYMASQAYFKLDDVNEATIWAERCQQAWNSCTEYDKSAAATWMLNIRLHDQSDQNELKDVFDSATLIAQQDNDDGRQQQAAEKLLLLLSTMQELNAAVPSTFVVPLNRLLDLMEDVLHKLPTDEADRKRASLYLHQAILLSTGSEKLEVSSNEEIAIELVNKASELFLKNDSEMEAATCQQINGISQLSMSRKSLKNQDAVASKVHFDKALEYLVAAKTIYERIQTPYELGRLSYSIAECCHEAWGMGWFSAEDCMEQITDAEQRMSSIRSEISVLGGMSAIVNKQAFSSDENFQSLYSFAMQICFQQNDTNLAWQWIQKGKARSLSDLLGLSVQVPQTLRLEIEGQLSSKHLFDEENATLKAISEGKNEDLFFLRVYLEKIRAKMTADPLLQELLDLREGNPIQLRSLQALLQRTSATHRTICIDWVIFDCQIYMFAVYPNADPVFHLLKISLPEIKVWIHDYFDSMEGREETLKQENDEDNPLRELDLLVRPLSELSDPGDLLVLCPSGLLHSLPLHALLVNDHCTSDSGVELVERNPFVYCASLTSFAQCCNRTHNNPPKDMAKKHFVAVYEPQDDGQDFDIDERRTVYSSMSSLASLVKANEVIVGESVTGDSLGKIIESSHLIHFHGHCDNSSSTSIVDQSLRLSSVSGKTAPIPFSVKDFFNHSMHAPLFTLMACGSAKQRISIGDEPLGLITAILCAGASSVIGTLWPVESGTARNFSRRFYAKFADQPQKTTTYGMFDVAVALQATMCELKGDFCTRQLNHWAPFVLHGACFSRFPMPSVGKLDQG